MLCNCNGGLIFVQPIAARVCNGGWLSDRRAEPSAGNADQAHNRRRSCRTRLPGGTKRRVFRSSCWDRTIARSPSRQKLLSERFQGLKVAGYFAPGANFDPYSSEADFAVDSIRASGAKLCFVALGAPRQELFAARCLDELDGTGLLCIGAALDFIAVPKPAHLPSRKRPGSNGRGGCCASRAGSDRVMHAAWRSYRGWWFVASRRLSTHEWGKRHDIHAHIGVARAQHQPRQNPIPNLPDSSIRSPWREGGGLETYIRDFITFHPADTDLLFIGVDSAGDLKLGEVHKLVFRGEHSISCLSSATRICRRARPPAASAPP